MLKGAAVYMVLVSSELCLAYFRFIRRRCPWRWLLTEIAWCMITMGEMETFALMNLIPNDVQRVTSHFDCQDSSDCMKTWTSQQIMMHYSEVQEELVWRRHDLDCQSFPQCMK